MITVFYKECSIKEANMTPGICKYVKKTVKRLIEEDVKNSLPHATSSSYKLKLDVMDKFGSQVLHIQRCT